MPYFAVTATALETLLHFQKRQNLDSSDYTIYLYPVTIHVRWFLKHCRSTTLSATMNNCLFCSTRSQIFIQCGFLCNVGSETNWYRPSFIDINNACWSLFLFTRSEVCGPSVLGSFSYFRSAPRFMVSSTISCRHICQSSSIHQESGNFTHCMIVYTPNKDR